MRQRGHRLVALRVSLLNLAKPLYNLPRSPRLALEHLRLNARAVATPIGGGWDAPSNRPKPYARRA